MVGSPQDIQCIVSTVSGVELSSVMISWMGPGGESITNDSRVTISPTTSSGNNYTSSLQFTYLMEGDEGMYTCNVMILETSASKTINIYNPISKLTQLCMLVLHSIFDVHNIALFYVRMHPCVVIYCKSPFFCVLEKFACFVENGFSHKFPECSLFYGNENGV